MVAMHEKIGTTEVMNNIEQKRVPAHFDSSTDLMCQVVIKSLGIHQYVDPSNHVQLEVKRICRHCFRLIFSILVLIECDLK